MKNKIGIFLLKLALVLLLIFILYLLYLNSGYEIVKREPSYVIMLPTGQKLISLDLEQNEVGIKPVTRKLKIDEEPTQVKISLSKYKGSPERGYVFIERE